MAAQVLVAVREWSPSRQVALLTDATAGDLMNEAHYSSSGDPRLRQVGGRLLSWHDDGDLGASGLHSHLAANQKRRSLLLLA
jgi:hypothetical protein